MRINYDPKYNIAYIKLRDKVNEVETIKVSDELNVDISPDGKIYGIELLNANEQLEIARNGGVILIEEASGKTVKLSIGK